MTNLIESYFALSLLDCITMIIILNFLIALISLGSQALAIIIDTSQDFLSFTDLIFR